MTEAPSPADVLLALGRANNRELIEELNRRSVSISYPYKLVPAGYPSPRAVAMGVSAYIAGKGEIPARDAADYSDAFSDVNGFGQETARWHEGLVADGGGPLCSGALEAVCAAVYAKHSEPEAPTSEPAPPVAVDPAPAPAPVDVVEPVPAPAPEPVEAPEATEPAPVPAPEPEEPPVSGGGFPS